MFTAVLALSTVSGRTNGLTFRMTFQKVTVKVGRSVTSLEEIYDPATLSLMEPNFWPIHRRSNLISFPFKSEMLKKNGNSSHLDVRDGRQSFLRVSVLCGQGEQ